MTNGKVVFKGSVLKVPGVSAAVVTMITSQQLMSTALRNDSAVAIAKSNDLTIANRMRKAGVTEIISPDQLNGERVSDLISIPDSTFHSAVPADAERSVLPELLCTYPDGRSGWTGWPVPIPDRSA